MNFIIHFTDNKNKYIAFGTLFFAAFLVRCVFFSGGIRGSDAYAYAQQSYNILTGQYIPAGGLHSFYGYQYILLLPTAFSYKLFGVNDFSSSLFPFFCSLLNFTVVYHIGRNLLGQKAAIIACILLTFYPLDIMMASLLSPDSFIPLLSSLSVLCYMISETQYSSTKPRTLYLVLAGLFVGLAISARLTSIFLYGVFVCHQIFTRRDTKSIFFISLGLVVPPSLEMFFYYLSTGDPFLRLHVTTTTALNILATNDYLANSISLFLYPRAMFGIDLHGLAMYGLIWWFASAGLLMAIIKRDIRILLPSIWIILPFIGFEFGLINIKDLTPIPKDYRYLSLMTPPLMIMGSYFWTEIMNACFEKKNRLIFIILSFMMLTCINLYGTFRLNLISRNDAATYIAVADFLKDKPHSVIYTHHPRWPLFLSYFFRYDPSVDFRTMEQFHEDETEKKMSGYYLIFHKRYLEANTAGRPFQQLPWYAIYYPDNPPQAWTRVFSFEGKPEYNSVVVYYAK